MIGAGGRRAGGQAGGGNAGKNFWNKQKGYNFRDLQGKEVLKN